MPDLNRLADQLHTDLSHTDWPDATRIRAAGDHRRHTRLAATLTAAAAAVAALAAAAVLLPGTAGRNTAPPATSHSSAVTPPSPSVSGSSSSDTLPTGVLLTAGYFAPFNRRVDPPTSSVAPGESFMICLGEAAHYKYPVGARPIAGLARRFTDGVQMNETFGDQIVQRFRLGGARLALADIDRLVGPCGPHVRIVDRNFAGDGSLLIISDQETVGSEIDPHAIRLFDEIIRRGDYLIWIRLIQGEDQAPGRGTYTKGQLIAWVRHLAARADQQLCTVTHC